jgi:hypothetical protein
MPTNCGTQVNLDQNKHNPFHARLTEMRARARQRARELPATV